MRYKKSTYSEHSWFLIRFNLPTNVVLIYIPLISHYNAIIILYYYACMLGNNKWENKKSPIQYIVEGNYIEGD